MVKIVSALAAGAVTVLTALSVAAAVSGGVASADGNPWHGVAPSSPTADDATVNGGGNPWYG